MATHNLNLEGLGHRRSQKQRRRMVLVAYVCYLGALTIVAVSVFNGHLLGPQNKAIPPTFSRLVLILALMFMCYVPLFISVFNNISLSRALPEYTMKQSALDERQLRVRDSAYRRSYFVIQFAILALFAFKLITLVPGVHIVQPSISLFEFTPLILSISGLFNLIPISIIAWNERD